MGLFNLGTFSLHSGKTSDFKIDCDALSDSDLECLAFLLARQLPAFGSVEGVPTGGLRLAAKMAPYVTQGPLLIVDDVLTTGGSLEHHRAGREAMGAVLFARGVVPAWIKALLTLGS